MANGPFYPNLGLKQPNQISRNCYWTNFPESLHKIRVQRQYLTMQNLQKDVLRELFYPNFGSKAVRLCDVK